MTRTFISRLSLAAMAGATTLLAGCGVDGPNGPDQSPGGIYLASITPSGALEPSEGAALINENGFGWIYNTDDDIIYFLNSSPDGNVLDAFARRFSAPNGLGIRSFFDGEAFGTIASRATINGTFAAPAGTEPFSLTFDPNLYSIPAALQLVEGRYRYILNNVSVDLTFTDTGNMTGTDTEGCTYNGFVTIPDREFNAYNLEASQNCAGSVQNINGVFFYAPQVEATPATLFIGYLGTVAGAAVVQARRL